MTGPVLQPRRFLVLAPDWTGAGDLERVLGHETERAVRTANGTGEALAALADQSFACLVVVPPLPETETTAFVETVRSAYPDLAVVAVLEADAETTPGALSVAGADDVVTTLGELSTSELSARLRGAVQRSGAPSDPVRVPFGSPAPSTVPSTSPSTRVSEETLLTLLRDVSGALASAATRRDLQQRCCDRLASSGLYTNVWYGSVDEADGIVLPEAWAGFRETELTDLRVALGGDGRTPFDRALETGDVTVASERSGAPRDPGGGTETVATAVVPVTVDGHPFGVLVVYSARSRAFGAEEYETLTALGDLLGHARLALECERTLCADATLSIEVAVTDERSPFVALTAETGATLVLEDIVADGGPPVVYLAAREVTPSTLRHRASERPAVAATRVVREYDEGFRLELALAEAESTALSVLVGHGASVTALEARDGTVWVEAELAQSATARLPVDALRAALPDARLESKRTENRPVRTVRGTTASLREELTDKQFRTLRRAYDAGYFERPRKTTGTELAEAMGVSSSTFHQHLDAALAKLVELVFDGSGIGEHRH